MKKMFVMAALAAAMVASPAMAEDFTGLRAEVTAGADLDKGKIANLSKDVTYGGAIGLDTTVLNDNIIVGVEANVDNFANYRDYGVSARVGYKVADSALVYAKAGYQDFRGLEGVRVGGGVELSLTKGFYTKAEYRYSDLELNTGRHQALVGFGVRF